MPTLTDQASRFFTYHDLIMCSDTARINNIANEPEQVDSWLALKTIATELLDPIVERFGSITLTYGFCSRALAKAIKKNTNPHIAPALDQHSAHELNTKDELICPRLGAAVDFTVDTQPDNIDKVALWIATNLNFDRMYYYGKSKPLHISYGHQNNQFVQLMNTNQATGRRMPASYGVHAKAVSLLSKIKY